MGTHKYTDIFFDWNGTIIDDLNINFEVINSLLLNYGKSTISLTEYRNAFSFPIKDFYGRIGLPINDNDYEKLVSDYWNLYKSKLQDVPLMNGISEIIHVLKERGINQYIISASDKQMILDQLSLYDIKDCFEDVIALENGYAHGKIEMAKQWLYTNNILKSNALMIGDTVHDYETAKAINIDCVLINKGHQNLKNCNINAEVVICDDLNELIDVVLQ